MSHARNTLIAALACLAALTLHAAAVLQPGLRYDDFQIVVRSLTWQATCDNLWVPANEHVMPLGRLSTWALVQGAGRVADIPRVTAWQGPVAVLVGIMLVGWFVRRELGHPLYGLVAFLLFGVTSVYQQAVAWFAATFAVLALDTTLLALLAAQAWRQTGRWPYLLLSAVAAALAPAWFASGALAGPLCFLYLLPRLNRPALASGAWLHFGAGLVPLLGSAAFVLLVFSLPRTADQILHLEHYQGKTAAEAFQPAAGLLSTSRSVVENLVSGAVGVSSVTCPLVLVPVAWLLLVALVVWWWRPVSERRLLVLGLGCILLSYFLVYSARADWTYVGHMNTTAWSRYHLFPQLGLSLIVCGGLPRWQGRVLHLDPSGPLSGQQVRALVLTTVLLFVSQLPRGILGTPAADPAQRRVLERVDAVDALCRRHHIAAEAARVALKPLAVPHCGERENAWELLRGSPDPRPLSMDEVRQLLEPAAEDGGR